MSFHHVEKLRVRYADTDQMGVVYYGNYLRYDCRAMVAGTKSTWEGTEAQLVACRRTFPLMEELHHRFGKQGLVILAINEDKSAASMKEFLKEYPVTFSGVRDAKKKLAAEVNLPALPTSYILDGNGRILSIQIGDSIMQNRRKFTKEIEELLAKNAKKP